MKNQPIKANIKNKLHLKWSLRQDNLNNYERQQMLSGGVEAQEKPERDTVPKTGLWDSRASAEDLRLRPARTMWGHLKYTVAWAQIGQQHQIKSILEIDR